MMDRCRVSEDLEAYDRATAINELDEARRLENNTADMLEEVARLSRMTAGERHGKPVIMSLCKDFADVAQWVFENQPTVGNGLPHFEDALLEVLTIAPDCQLSQLVRAGIRAVALDNLGLDNDDINEG